MGGWACAKVTFFYPTLEVLAVFSGDEMVLELCEVTQDVNRDSIQNEVY